MNFRIESEVADIFGVLSTEETENVVENWKRLEKQYKLLMFAKKLEKVKIPVIDIIFFRFFSMLIDFLRWKLYDFLILLIEGRKFNLYGVTCFCGRQGSGKTLGIVETLEDIRIKYPDCIIATNINYIHEDIKLTSWLQLLYLRNGDDGVVFVIDEVQNNGLDWTKFPETLLQVITMQRKQKIKIFLSSQVYKNVVIQLRRQCYEVVECKTFFGRWTKHRCYDADEYNTIIDVATPNKRIRMHKKWKHSYIQSNYLRSLYDTNQVVDTLRDFDKLSSDEVKDHIKKLRSPSARRVISIGKYEKGKRLL